MNVQKQITLYILPHQRVQRRETYKNKYVWLCVCSAPVRSRSFIQSWLIRCRFVSVYFIKQCSSQFWTSSKEERAGSFSGPGEGRGRNVLRVTLCRSRCYLQLLWNESESSEFAWRFVGTPNAGLWNGVYHDYCFSWTFSCFVVFRWGGLMSGVVFLLLLYIYLIWHITSYLTRKYSFTAYLL